MGYTVKAAPDMIAFGISGIGDVAGAYAQNVKKLSDYYNLLDAGRFPVERGYILEEDDHIRRYVIHALMCNLELDFDHLRKRFGIEYEEYFRDEDQELVTTIEPGFFERTPQRILVTPLGQLFVRNICMIYDRYLRNLSPDKNIFSRTV
jgi:oxygen-independent coproporphyrinogen-3 oxidase